MEEGESELRPKVSMDSTRKRWRRGSPAEEAGCAKAEQKKVEYAARQELKAIQRRLKGEGGRRWS